MQKLLLNTLEWNSTQEPYLCDSLELSAVCTLTSKHEILGPAYVRCNAIFKLWDLLGCIAIPDVYYAKSSSAD